MRHRQKIVASVLDRVPFQHTWHVIECACGWSSALHANKLEATKAYDDHKPASRKKKAA